MEIDLQNHTSHITLRPNDFDWSRFLNNSVYPQLFEQARWEWALSNRLNLMHDRLAAVVVRQEIDYVHPVTWAPVVKIQVDTSLICIAPYSIKLHQTVRLGSEVKARGVLKLALYDFLQHRVVRVTPEMLRGSDLAL